MNLFRLSLVGFCVFLFAVSLDSVGFAEPKVQILSPKDGSRITQDQKSIFVSGKVAREAGRSERVDIFLRHRYFRQHRIVCRRGFGRGRSTAGNFRISHAADLDRRNETRQAPATKPAQLDPRRRSRRGAAIASSTQSRHDPGRCIDLQRKRKIAPTTDQDFDQVRRILAEVLRAVLTAAPTWSKVCAWGSPN